MRISDWSSDVCSSDLLQADAYAGYNALFHADRLPAPLTRALCWSHARRYFFELADVAAQLKKRRKKAVISPLAVEAVRRIDAIFDIERAINGRPAQDRQSVLAGKSVSVRCAIGGRRIINQKKN